MDDNLSRNSRFANKLLLLASCSIIYMPLFQETFGEIQGAFIEIIERIEANPETGRSLVGRKCGEWNHRFITKDSNNTTGTYISTGVDIEGIDFSRQ